MARHRVDSAVHRLLAGDVHLHGHRLGAGLFQFADDAACRRHVDVADRQTRALAGETQRDLPADPRSRARDDRDIALHLHVISPPLSRQLKEATRAVQHKRSIRLREPSPTPERQSPKQSPAPGSVCSFYAVRIRPGAEFRRASSGQAARRGEAERPA